MKTILHKAATRGHANHGWLDTYHTFSFAGYYDPTRIHFGALRVLNDDTVTGGMGFGQHPHDNMEIISIPLKGALEHKDSMGNKVVINENDVQIMSAGTGVEHSEYNHSKSDPVNFLQIWVFPKEDNIEPRYDQRSFDPLGSKNQLQQMVSPLGVGTGIGINQDAWFHRGVIEKGKSVKYDIQKVGNGVYAFIISGSVKVGDQSLERRDGVGMWEVDSLTIEAREESEVLLIEVPMEG